MEKPQQDLTEIQWLSIFRMMTKKEFKIYSNLVDTKNRAQINLSKFLEQAKKKYMEKVL